MELSTILVGGVILLAMFVPVVYMIKSASGSDGKAKKTLTKLAASKNLNLKDIEVHGNIVIGLNEDLQQMAYSYKTDVAQYFEAVDLSKLKSSRVKTTFLSEKTLETVTLDLAGQSRNYGLIFYDDNDETNHSLDPQIALQTAKELDRKINKLI